MTLVALNEDGTIIVRRIPEGVARRENDLRDLIFERPEILPVEDIDPSIGPLTAIAKELNVPGVGRIDALLCDPRGRLVVVECKLWRNPQARREVVGQILDYARELARFSYDDLQREVSASTGRKGNVLHGLVADHDGALGEADFVDQVSRSLAAGRFLLMVVGDGIAEGTRRIGEYLKAQPGLAFDFALVEMAEYRLEQDGREQTIIQPRLLARTAVIERAVIRNESDRITIENLDSEQAPTPRQAGGRQIDPAFQQQWRDFAERLIARIEFDDPAQPPPRIGGLGWMRVTLPGPAHLTLWRSKADNTIGGLVRYRGSEGSAFYRALAEDREAIDREFAEAGLDCPFWSSDDEAGSLTLTRDAQWPWDDTDEESQSRWLGRVANRFVNSLRPRLENVASDASQF